MRLIFIAAVALVVAISIDAAPVIQRSKIWKPKTLREAEVTVVVNGVPDAAEEEIMKPEGSNLQGPKTHTRRAKVAVMTEEEATTMTTTTTTAVTEDPVRAKETVRKAESLRKIKEQLAISRANKTPKPTEPTVTEPFATETPTTVTEQAMTTTEQTTVTETPVTSRNGIKTAIRENMRARTRTTTTTSPTVAPVTETLTTTTNQPDAVELTTVSEIPTTTTTATTTQKVSRADRIRIAIRDQLRPKSRINRPAATVVQAPAKVTETKTTAQPVVTRTAEQGKVIEEPVKASFVEQLKIARRTKLASQDRKTTPEPVITTEAVTTTTTTTTTEQPTTQPEVEVTTTTVLPEAEKVEEIVTPEEPEETTTTTTTEPSTTVEVTTTTTTTTTEKPAKVDKTHKPVSRGDIKKQSSRKAAKTTAAPATTVTQAPDDVVVELAFEPVKL